MGTLPRVRKLMLALGAGHKIMVLAQMFQLAGRNLVLSLRALAKQGLEDGLQVIFAAPDHAAL